MVHKKHILTAIGVCIGTVILIGIILGCTLTKKKEVLDDDKLVKNKTGRGYRIQKLVQMTLQSQESIQQWFGSKTELKVKLSDVTFYLYTKKNKNAPFVILKSDISKLDYSNFDPGNKIIFICHGWVNNYESPINILIKNAILEKYNLNIFTIDWSGPASKSYFISKNSVVAVGKIVGNFLNKIQDTYKLLGDSFILIGHSLGAHVIGNAGATIKNKASYILGLDPAGPLFNGTDYYGRLNKTNAKYVEIIHTNGAVLGIDYSIGHADYYPNGGFRQIGCGMDPTGICAHSRAYEYFAEAISRGEVFLAVKCLNFRNFKHGECLNNRKSFMGKLEPDTTITGDYFLNTNSEPPFAKGNVMESIVWSIQ